MSISFFNTVKTLNHTQSHNFFYHYFKWTTKYVSSSSFYYCSIKSNCCYLAMEPAPHEQQSSSSVHLCFGNHGAAGTFASLRWNMAPRPSFLLVLSTSLWSPSSESAGIVHVKLNLMKVVVETNTSKSHLLHLDRIEHNCGKEYFPSIPDQFSTTLCSRKSSEGLSVENSLDSLSQCSKEMHHPLQWLP